MRGPEARILNSMHQAMQREAAKGPARPDMTAMVVNYEQRQVEYEDAHGTLESHPMSRPDRHCSTPTPRDVPTNQLSNLIQSLDEAILSAEDRRGLIHPIDRFTRSIERLEATRDYYVEQHAATNHLDDLPRHIEERYSRTAEDVFPTRRGGVR